MMFFGFFKMRRGVMSKEIEQDDLILTGFGYSQGLVINFN